MIAREIQSIPLVSDDDHSTLSLEREAMGIFDLFSKRRADAEKSGQPDVYQYEQIPNSLRVQVHQIALEAIGLPSRYARGGGGDLGNDIWEMIEKVYLREKGLDAVAHDRHAGDRLLAYMRACSTDDWLDLLELIGVAIQVANDQSPYWQDDWGVTEGSDKAIEELNYRMRQAGLGYQLEAGRLVRVDSQFVHAEVVKPALSLLSKEGFDGPREEFLAAHKHYRAGEHRQAVSMAANALESTLKAIFDIKGWGYSKGARISDLIKVARTNKLWPDYLDSSFDQLVATLQSGLPKIRDNDASHGQGAKPKKVPAYIAALALHLAASKIVFLIEAAGDS